MYNVTPLPNTQVALFVDLESLVGFSTQLGAPVELQPVFDRLASDYGRVVLARSYGDLEKSCPGEPVRRQMRRMLQKCSVDIVDVPYVTSKKNSADIRIAVEAIHTACSRPDIGCCAIMSSDQDFRHVINKWKEMGKTAIGIGIRPDLTNETYVRSCDAFLYYEALFRKGGFPPAVDADPLVGQSLEATRNIYMELLVEAVRSLERRGSKPVGSSLVPQIKTLKPDFDLKLAGFRSLREMVEQASRLGHVVVDAVGTDIVVSLPAVVPTALETKPLVAPFDPTNPEAMAASYNEALVSALKCPLPDVVRRETIYCTSEEILRELRSEDCLTLSSLVKQVRERLGQDAPSSAATFKLLYSLTRQMCFHCSPSLSPFDPTIHGIQADRKSWDDLFVKNCLTLLQLKFPDMPVLASGLAIVLARDEADVERFMLDVGI